MASGRDIRAALDLPAATEAPKAASQTRPSHVATSLAREIRRPQPRMFKKPSIRNRARAAKWSSEPSRISTRSDALHFRRWQRIATDSAPQTMDKFDRFNVQASVPDCSSGTYDKHLTHADWSKEETSYLMDLYRECNGKWPVIADHYSFEDKERSMEDLKHRFYTVSAILLSLTTPITSMTAADYTLYETLSNFNPAQETSRKKLAEGHLYRRANEVDEETVLLGELQRIMLSQASLDSEREELRRRLDFPHATTNGYQYTTSQSLTQLWQQLLAQDRMKKNPRLRPTGNPAYDGFSAATPTSARPRDSTAGLPESATTSGRRLTRDSLPSATPQSALPSELSKTDMLRFGVVQQQEKLPSGITFASDKLSKPRVAKSAVQTEKIAAILSHIGVPDLIPLPTPAVIESFEGIMAKVHALLDLRKIAEKEEQELKVRTAETPAT